MRSQLLKIFPYYYFFFVVFLAVVFLAVVFFLGTDIFLPGPLPGPLSAMSLLLSSGYRFRVTPIRNIKLTTRGSERSPSNAGEVFR